MSDFSIQAVPATSKRPIALSRGAIPILPGLVAGVAVGGLAVARGGYFPTSWGWAAVPLCWVAAVALCLGAPALGRLELVLISSLMVFVGWIALSTAWSLQPSQTVLELERALVYPAAALAVLVLARRTAASQVLAGVLGGIVPVCAYALATRLFPERLGSFDSIAGYRLSHPVTYWNALGILAAMGVLLALDFALRSRGSAGQALGAAALPVLLPTLYFTYSRGAWVALAVGLAASLAIDPRRLELTSGAVLIFPAAIATWLASRSASLTHVGSTLTKATADGHRLALAVVALAVASAGLALAFGRARERVRVSPNGRRAYAGALLLMIAVAVMAAFIRYGGPVGMVRTVHGSFESAPRQVAEGASLNHRLFTFSSNGRLGLWRIAVNDFESRPLLGSGAGSYEAVYLLHRPTGSKVRDAHSLYLETLAELGVVGLVLLVATLLVPVVGAVRARRNPLVPVAFGAYVAFLVHAGVDWDWEVTAVTLAALLCGVAIVLAGRSDRDPRRNALFTRVLLLLVAVGVGVFSFVGLIGNTAVASSQQAIVDHHWATAAAQARRAIRWAPWSPHGRQYLGEAQFALGRYAVGKANVRRAILQDPRDWDLWWTLALLTGGSTREQATLAARRLNPHSPELAEWIAGVGLKLPPKR